MRRCVLQLLLVAALGIITTVGVAWGVANWRPIPMYPRTQGGSFERWDRGWSVAEAPVTGALDSWWDELTSDGATPEAKKAMAGPAVEKMRATHAQLAKERPFAINDTPRAWGTFAQRNPPPPDVDMGADTAYGWPRLCLWHRTMSTFDPVTSSVSGGMLEGGILVFGKVDVRGHDYRALPLRPIWSGLAVNALVFGLMWWLLLFVPGIVRRRLRAKRGACLRCGYDLRATPAGSPCPECGGAERSGSRGGAGLPGAGPKVPDIDG